VPGTPGTARCRWREDSLIGHGTSARWRQKPGRSD
jgi:hypothetical protein